MIINFYCNIVYTTNNKQQTTMPKKSRCTRGHRKCGSMCVKKEQYKKIKKCAKGSKKCADQSCHKTKTRRRSSPVKSNYSLRSRK